MKKVIPLLLIVCLWQTGFAQQPVFANPYPKTISVSGSAEMEIVPDQIFVNITLKEYQKKGDPKKDLETIKAQFLESCKTIGIPDSVISIIFYSGYSNSYYYIRRKKAADLMANITYQVRFKDAKLMDDLVDKLDDNATQSFNIVSTSHSKITEFRKQLKIKAIQSAKEKGLYLTEAVGEKLGDAVTIQEPGESQASIINASNSYYDNVRIRGIGSNTNYFAKENYDLSGVNGNGSAMDVDFKKIKLRYEVNVVFALK